MEYTLEHIEEQMKFWQEQKAALLKVFDEQSINENTENLLKRISEVKDGNSYIASIYKDTKTVSMIDQYLASKKEFLVFKDYFYFDGKWLSPVVVYTNKRIRYYTSDLTMTNFRMMDCSFRKNLGIKWFCNEEQREYTLIKCLFDLEFESDKKALSFDYPCQFNAQSSSNRTGYGNEYNGEDLVSEGTKYGETTRFFIIGVLIRDN